MNLKTFLVAPTIFTFFNPLFPMVSDSLGIDKSQKGKRKDLLIYILLSANYLGPPAQFMSYFVLRFQYYNWIQNAHLMCYYGSWLGFMINDNW